MGMITTISRIFGLFGAVLMALTGAMLSFEVVARYFFVKPTIWAAELSQLCLIWGCLISMGWLLNKRRHITVNAVTALLPPRAQKACVAAALICIIAFSAIVAIWGWDIFYHSFTRGSTTGSLLNLPKWVAELPVALGFGLLALQALAELVALPKDDTYSLGASHE